MHIYTRKRFQIPFCQKLLEPRQTYRLSLRPLGCWIVPEKRNATARQTILEVQQLPLMDKTYVEQIQDLITNFKKEYAIPVYDYENINCIPIVTT